jgi:integrase
MLGYPWTVGYPMARIDLLTDRKVAALKPRGTPFKVYDGRGLHIWVSPTAKAWRLRFKLDDKERLMGLGQFPDVDIREARDRRDAARKLIAKSIDPVQQRRNERAAKTEARGHTFQRWAEAYFAHNANAWSNRHQRDVRRILDELNASIGDKAMSGLRPEDIEGVLEDIERRGALSYARDVRLYFRLVVRHHNVKNRQHRIADPSVDVEIKKAPPVRHHASLDPSEIGGFLRALNSSNAAPLIRFALRLLVATAVRTTELRLAKWSEIDTKAKIWRIPSDRMKARREHLIPLADPVLELLAEIRRISGGNPEDYLFPHLFECNQPISDGTIINAIKFGCGYRGRATGHGMRRTFSTWANEQGFHPDAIERQLAHVEHNQVRAAYNAAEHLPERKRLMAAWAEFLEESERSARITRLRAVGVG